MFYFSLNAIIGTGVQKRPCDEDSLRDRWELTEQRKNLMEEQKLTQVEHRS